MPYLLQIPPYTLEKDKNHQCHRERLRGIGRFKDEERALAFVYRQMKENQERWKGLSMTDEAKDILRLLKSIKMERLAP